MCEHRLDAVRTVYVVKLYLLCLSMLVKRSGAKMGYVYLVPMIYVESVE
jgi:hypothetical protein